ncbi:MAG TPA: hypothetical protein VJS13_16505 [Pyrinomonadaceae bacterium]|nr:hypothetical protein [Pyrinomonadaceae bacterium]
MSRFYETEAEIEQVVRGFENCATPASDFHHREHLTVAVWYLQTLSRRETVNRMRSALLRFLDHHGVDRKKYSEDVTVYWVDAVASHLEGMSANASLVDRCNQVIEAFVSSTVRTPAARVEAEVSLGKS